MSIPRLPKALTVGELALALLQYPDWSHLWIADLNGNNFAVATGTFKVQPDGPFARDVVIETRPEAAADLHAEVAS